MARKAVEDTVARNRMTTKEQHSSSSVKRRRQREKKHVTFTDEPPSSKQFNETDCVSSLSRPSSDLRHRKLEKRRPREVRDDDDNSSTAADHSAAFAPYWVDKRLVNSKIFRLRIFRAAVKIQSLFRRFMVRKEYYRALMLFAKDRAATSIQRVGRGWLARRERQRIQAVVQIQSTFRGWYGRMLAQIQALERRTQRVEQLHNARLQRVDSWKQSQMDEMQGMIDASLEGYLQLRSKARLEMERVMDLRQQNEQLLQANHRLDEEREDLTIAKETLMTRSSDCNQDAAEVCHKLGTFQREYQQWQEINDRCQALVAKRQATAERLEAGAMRERAFRLKFERTINGIVKYIGMQDMDLYLELSLDQVYGMPRSSSHSYKDAGNHPSSRRGSHIPRNIALATAQR